MWILFYFFSVVSDASCLPSIEELNVPASYFSCSTDKDCTIYKDACRSCGSSLVAVNSRYSDALKKLDYDARIKAKCVLSCEACSTSNVVVKCLKNKCSTIK